MIYELFNIILIGFALSMDAFAMSFSIGLINSKNNIFLSVIVGIFHFVMPLVGFYIGGYILKYIPLKPNLIIGVIFIILSLKTIVETFKNKQKETIFKFFGLIILAFSVSIDSFSTGFGLSGITHKYILTASIFSLISFITTFIGVYFAQYLKEKIKNKASIIGAIFLLILGVIYLCKL